MSRFSVEWPDTEAIEIVIAERFKIEAGGVCVFYATVQPTDYGIGGLPYERPTLAIAGFRSVAEVDGE